MYHVKCSKDMQVPITGTEQIKDLKDINKNVWDLQDLIINMLKTC